MRLDQSKLNNKWEGVKTCVKFSVSIDLFVRLICAVELSTTRPEISSHLFWCHFQSAAIHK